MSKSRLFLLENAQPLVTMDPQRRLLDPGWVAAKDGMIVSLGEGRAPDLIDGVPRRDWARHDAAGCVVLPGLINTHHHLFQTLTRAHPGALNHGLSGPS
jgi:cytosine/adenosine deaminase-related metal-dependent hydrolase